MPTALLIVDVQNDFLPGGSLAVPDGEKVIEPLLALAKRCDVVIASRDWHPPNHKSFGQHAHWPPHCVQNTFGAKVHPKIRKVVQTTVTKGMDPEKDDYSAFNGHTLRPVRTLDQLLAEAGMQKYDRVFVGGLALDYCVRWTALDANARGYETIVPLDCTKPVGLTITVSAFERAGVLFPDSWKEYFLQ